MGDENHLYEWDAKQLKNLKSELKKLIPPIEKDLKNNLLEKLKNIETPDKQRR